MEADTKIHKDWTIKTAMEQLESCPYECEAGNLQNNDAYHFLQNMAKYSPKFYIGQHVQHFVNVETSLGNGGDWFDCVVVGNLLVMGQYEINHCYQLAKGTHPKPQSIDVDIERATESSIRKPE